MTDAELQEFQVKARKWDIYQQERALDDAEKDRFVKLMQADEDKLKEKARKWDRVKEIAEIGKRPDCNGCPIQDINACGLELCRSAKTLVQAIEVSPLRRQEWRPSMPKTVKVDIIENCNDCPYRADHHLYYDCTLCKDKRFDDDFPAIPAWCKLDSVQDITWDEWIAEVTA